MKQLVFFAISLCITFFISGLDISRLYKFILFLIFFKFGSTLYHSLFDKASA